MGKMGLAVGLSTLANGMLEEAKRRREFGQRVQEAILKSQLDTGAIEPTGSGEASDVQIGGFGFKKVSDTDRNLKAMKTLREAQSYIPQNVQGGYLPKFDSKGRISGYDFHGKSISSTDQVIQDALNEQGGAAPKGKPVRPQVANDPIAKKIQQLRASGIPDDRIKKDLAAKGYDPAAYGL